ncbi:hypothetical protein M9H77_11012 [Catharanthus roseus]|uniref:Uncharacterized protein n=1 Tax=Catharanthus roseus TaxID=4058 RepID=A0ACC0BDE3_CATRO|nr:hypothetical protein M9H77_11012 [Catharanthus roseus]
MDHFKDFLQENIYFEDDIDSNTFEEFLEPVEHVDHRHLFLTYRIFNSKIELVDWAKETVMKVNTYLIVIRYLKSRTSDRIQPCKAPQIDPCHPRLMYQNSSLNKDQMREFHNQWLYNYCSKNSAPNCNPGPLTSFNGC